MLDMGFRPAVDRIVSRHPARPPDAVLLGHAGRRGRQDRLRLHARRPHPRARAPSRSCAADVEPPLRRRRPTRASWTPSCDELRREASDRRSCSCAPSAARTAWSSAFAPMTSRRWRCTATSPSPSGSRRSPVRRRAAWTRWWPPTWPPAASTSTTSRTSSTSMPRPDHDGYVHRVGRTGRAGRSGIGITLRLGRRGRGRGPDREEAAPRAGARRRRPRDPGLVSPERRRQVPPQRRRRPAPPRR